MQITTLLAQGENLDKLAFDNISASSLFHQADWYSSYVQCKL